MNEVSPSDPAAQVAEVRRIIEGRGSHSCEATLLQIRRVVDPPPPAQPIELDEDGWPVLRPSDRHDTGTRPGYDAGTAWERHDDPEADR